MKRVAVLVLFFLVSYISKAQPIVSDIQPQGGGLTKVNACIAETVRLVGSGFQPTGATITVNSGPVASVYTYISSSIIEFQIPVGSPVTGLGVVVTIASIPSAPRILLINPGITILSQPILQELCEGGSFSFSLNAVGTTLSFLWKKDGNSTGITASSISGIATLADSGAIYTADVISLTCGATIPTNPVKLLVNQKPTNPPTLPNLENCQNGSFTMNAPTPNAGTGTWSCVNNCNGVSFGNTHAPTTSISGVPVSAAPQLQWTVVNGFCSATSSVTIKNYGMPTSTASITGGDVNTCITNPTVALTGTVASGTYTSVSWTLQAPSNGSFSTPAAPYTSFTPSVDGVYKLNYSILNGACSSVSPDKKITVYKSPVVSAGNDKTECFGIPVNFTASISNVSIYGWAASGYNGTFSSLTNLNTTYTPGTTDSVGVSFGLVFTGSNAGCTSASDTISVTIRSKPHASIASALGSNICTGTSVVIPVNLSGTPPFSGLALSDGSTNFNLGTISGTTANTSRTPAVTTNYTLAASGNFKDANNCIGSFSGSHLVTVTPQPTASINVTPAIICDGGAATLSINPSFGGGPNWKVYMNTGGSNAPIIINSGNYTASVSPLANTTYTIDSIETTTCGKIKLSGINKTLTVYNTPVVSASMMITPSDDTLCVGESTTISISGLQSNTIYKLIKNFAGISLDSIVVDNTGSGTYDISIPHSKFTAGQMDTIKFVARREGCATTIHSVTKTYIWSSSLTSPVITVSANTAACERKILEAVAQPNASYQWYEGNSTLVGKTTEKDTAYFSGIYSLKASDNLNCRVVSNSIAVDYSGQQPNVSHTEISSVKTMLTTTTTADAYYWYVQTESGIKKIQNASTTNLPVYFDGNYYLGIANGSCFFLSAPYSVSGKSGGSLLRQSFVETDSSVVLPEGGFSAEVKVYPNPVVNTDFMVDYVSSNATQTTFILYNSQGMSVVEKEIDGNGLLRVNIPSNGLPSGIYILTINDGVNQVRKNVMIY